MLYCIVFYAMVYSDPFGSAPTFSSSDPFASSPFSSSSDPFSSSNDPFASSAAFTAQPAPTVFRATGAAPNQNNGLLDFGF